MTPSDRPTTESPTEASLRAYHGDVKLKRAMLREVRKHEKADQIVAGTYGRQNGKWVGCAVGCSIHSLALIQGRTLDTADHSLFASEAGVPIMLARLQDMIFEGMPADKRAQFPARFWSAIKPGADLSTVGWKFLHWLLTRSGIGSYEHPLVRDAVAQCAAVLLPLTRGEPVNASAASAARCAASAAESAARSAVSTAWSAARSAASAARSAAESAAWSAARSAESTAWSAARSAESAACAANAAESAARSAESTARSAARSAASAARSAAESAAWSAASAAWSAARSAAYDLMADQLVLLLKEAA